MAPEMFHFHGTGGPGVLNGDDITVCPFKRQRATPVAAGLQRELRNSSSDGCRKAMEFWNNKMKRERGGWGHDSCQLAEVVIITLK